MDIERLVKLSNTQEDYYVKKVLETILDVYGNTKKRKTSLDLGMLSPKPYMMTSTSTLISSLSTKSLWSTRGVIIPTAVGL